MCNRTIRKTHVRFQLSRVRHCSTMIVLCDSWRRLVRPCVAAKPWSHNQRNNLRLSMLEFYSSDSRRLRRSLRQGAAQGQFTSSNAGHGLPFLGLDALHDGPRAMVHRNMSQTTMRGSEPPSASLDTFSSSTFPLLSSTESFLWNVPESVAFASRTSTHSVTLDQCAFGARWREKETDFWFL